jgi:hypothetical protein
MYPPDPLVVKRNRGEVIAFRKDVTRSGVGAITPGRCA